MKRTSRTSIAIAAASVLIGAGATTVAHAGISSESAKGATSVAETTLADTTASGPRTGDLAHSVANLLAEIDRLEAAIAAGTSTAAGSTLGDSSSAPGDSKDGSTSPEPSASASPEPSASASPEPSETASPEPSETDAPEPTPSSTTSTGSEAEHQSPAPGGPGTQQPQEPNNG